MFVAPEILIQFDPPLVLTCHCTVGVGLPVAAAVKLAVEPAVTVVLLGFRVMKGAAGVLPLLTVNVAAELLAEPTELVNTARYW